MGEEGFPGMELKDEYVRRIQEKEMCVAKL